MLFGRKRPPPPALVDDPAFRREFRAWVFAAGSPDQPDLHHWSAMVRMIETRRGRRRASDEPEDDLWGRMIALESTRLADELGWSDEQRAAFASALRGVVEQLVRVDVYGFDERAAYEWFRSTAQSLRLDQAAPPGTTGDADDG